MCIKLTAALLLLATASSATADTLNGCNLLSHADLEQLQAPKDATATSDVSGEDGMRLCRYAHGSSFKLMVAFGRLSGESSRKFAAMMKQMKSAPTSGAQSDVAQPDLAQPKSDRALNDLGFCTINAMPEGQVVSCSGIRKDIALTMVMMRAKSNGVTQVSAAALLQTFTDIFAKVKL